MRGKESENETSPPGPTAAAALKSDIDPYWPIYQFLIFWHLNQILNTINDVFKVCSATLQADAESESKEALLSLPPDIVDVSILSFFPTRYYSTTRILSSLPYPTLPENEKPLPFRACPLVTIVNFLICRSFRDWHDFVY